MAFKKIKFVTDSVADVSSELAEKWDITVVPCFVNFGGESYADDGVQLVREDFYARMGAMPDVPTTAAMPPEFAREFIESAYEGADHLIIITTPAKLSGIYNAMRLAASELPQDKVTLIDSGQISLGMAWQVILGAEIAAETGDVEKTLAAIKSARQHQYLYAAVDSLESLRRSGRVGLAAASVGTLLQVKPIVRVDGDANVIARVRTFKKALDKLSEIVHDHAPIDKLAMAHINNPEGLKALKERVADIAPPETDMMISTIAPAIGVHTGPGTVGIGVVKKGWKDAITAGDAG